MTRTNPTPLLRAEDFEEYSTVFLNKDGHYIDPGSDLEEMSDGKPISIESLEGYFRRRVVLPADVTDVFVWVHGWRNGQATARAAAQRLFNGIKVLFGRDGQHYPRLARFEPAFIAVRWPSNSNPFPSGYERIRDRARDLTENGDAEFFLASLLGYLQTKKPDTSAAVLRARGGFYVHCVGHSFGGRFLTAAVRASATPRPRTLTLLGAAAPGSRRVLSAATANGFEFTVDSFLIFQMAAPSAAFGDELTLLVTKAPLSGCVALTHSRHDRANCLWHRIAEKEPAIGCGGASQPTALLGRTELHGIGAAYTPEELAGPIVNVDANWAYQDAGYKVEGAHSDIWYEESVHLLLSLVEMSRRPPVSTRDVPGAHVTRTG